MSQQTNLGIDFSSFKGHYFRDEETGELVHGTNGKPVGAAKNQPEVMKLWHVNNEIARLVVLGHKESEIAEILQISPSTVWNALNRNPLVQERIELLQGERDASTVDVQRKVKAMQPIALEVLEQDLMEENPAIVSRKLRNETARKVLEMGGNGPIKKVDSRHAVFTAADLQTINQRAAELRSKREIFQIPADEVDETSPAIPENAGTFGESGE